VLLTQHELIEDPRDIMANFFINISSQFTISTQYFGAFYLISHGIIKVILAILLFKRKLWAYPLAILVLIIFIIYQIYRYTLNPSALLVILTAFDIAVIVLTYIEYTRIKTQMI